MSLHLPRSIRGLRLAAVLVLVVLLMGCSRTVQWEEEVLLNTGETIWVTRKHVYEFTISADNPFIPKYYPARPTSIEFSYRNKKYSHQSEAHPILLAISPVTLQPTLVAPASTWGWGEQNSYRCANPYYVQFVQHIKSSEWTWPLNIETWLYDLPANLMSVPADRDSIKANYRLSDKVRAPTWHTAHLHKIDPRFTPDNCNK